MVKSEEAEVFDKVDFIDRKEFEERCYQLSDNAYRQAEYFRQKIKTLAVIGGVVAGAICFVIAMRKD